MRVTLLPDRFGVRLRNTECDAKLAAFDCRSRNIATDADPLQPERARPRYWAQGFMLMKVDVKREAGNWTAMKKSGLFRCFDRSLGAGEVREAIDFLEPLIEEKALSAR